MFEKDPITEVNSIFDYISDSVSKRPRIIEATEEQFIPEMEFGERKSFGKTICPNKLNCNPGDILAVKRGNGLYYHYGVYVGNAHIIHYNFDSKDPNTIKRRCIHKAFIKEFLNDSYSFYVLKFAGDKLFEEDGDNKLSDDYIYDNYHIYSPEKTIARAESMIDQTDYSLIFNNCEHFAMWCKTGLKESLQVKKAKHDAVRGVFLTQNIVHTVSAISKIVPLLFI